MKQIMIMAILVMSIISVLCIMTIVYVQALPVEVNPELKPHIKNGDIIYAAFEYTDEPTDEHTLNELGIINFILK